MNRRDILKIAVSLIFPIQANADSTKIFKCNTTLGTRITASMGASLVQECQIVYKHWTLTEQKAPEKYFIDRMALHDIDPCNFSELRNIDLDEENSINVNGLVLGKTEAALIAYLGSQVFFP